jgi:hypothetical protein
VEELTVAAREFKGGSDKSRRIFMVFENVAKATADPSVR